MKRWGVLTLAVGVLVIAGCGSSAENHGYTEPVPSAEAEEKTFFRAPRNEAREELHADQRKMQHEIAREERQEASAQRKKTTQLPADSDPAPTSPGEVSKAEFGSKWPLSVPSGTLRCESLGPEFGEVIFTAPDGTEYGLNGTAQDQGGHPPIDPIWVYEPGMKKYGLKINMSPLLERGLAMC